MKFAFVTCVELGARCMEEIYRSGYSLDLVITLQDHISTAKSGRVYADKFCESNGIEILKVRHINDEAVIERIREMEIDWLFIVGWSQIAGEAVLKAPRRGALGIHPTLLPEGRGRAAIPWAILKKLNRTGVTLFKLDSGVDTGPILGQVEIELTDSTTAAELYNRVNEEHVALIRMIMPKLAGGSIELKLQDESLATIWPGRTPADGAIDLEGSVYDAERLIRAVSRPYPGAFFHKEGRRCIVWKSHICQEVDGQNEQLKFKDGTLTLDEIEFRED